MERKGPLCPLEERPNLERVEEATPGRAQKRPPMHTLSPYIRNKMERKSLVLGILEEAHFRLLREKGTVAKWCTTYFFIWWGAYWSLNIEGLGTCGAEIFRNLMPLEVSTATWAHGCVRHPLKTPMERNSCSLDQGYRVLPPRKSLWAPQTFRPTKDVGGKRTSASGWGACSTESRVVFWCCLLLDSHFL